MVPFERRKQFALYYDTASRKHNLIRSFNISNFCLFLAHLRDVDGFGAAERNMASEILRSLSATSRRRSSFSARRRSSENPSSNERLRMTVLLPALMRIASVSTKEVAGSTGRSPDVCERTP